MQLAPWMRWVQRDGQTAALLCVAAGVADAVGYIQAGVFAANMTGNTVLTGISLANADLWTALDRALTFVTFFGGAMFGRLTLRYANSPWLPLLVEAVVLGMSMFVSNHALAVLCIALAMGIQATAITKFKGAAISTVVLTSTMARLAENTLDLIARDRILAPVGRNHPAGLLTLTWIAYGLGAMVTALLLKVTAIPLLVAVVIVLVLSFSFWRSSRSIVQII